ncbi:MAG: ribonuclease P protein component [Patescibacteria group bacterium]
MLPRSRRLRSADFKLLREARTVHFAHFFVRVKRGPKEGANRAAVVASIKAARTAAARNRLRRRVYAALEKLLPKRGGLLLVVTAKSGAAALSFAEILRELRALAADASFC